MSYAVKKNGTSWRAVDGPADVAVDEVFSETQPPLVTSIPNAVSMRQARLALLQAGLLTQINTAVANMPGAAGDAARITWEFSGEVRRDDTLMTQLATALNLSAAQLDQLFITAGGL